MSQYPAVPDPTSARALPADPFKDERGIIQPMVDAPIGGAAIIHSVKGAYRANHFHRLDWHYCYMISGSMAYYHRPQGSIEKPAREVFKAGDMFYSPPMVEHTMEFLEDSSFVVLSGLHREHENYEQDVVRVPNLATIFAEFGQ